MIYDAAIPHTTTCNGENRVDKHGSGIIYLGVGTRYQDSAERNVRPSLMDKFVFVCDLGLLLVRHFGQMVCASQLVHVQVKDSKDRIGIPKS